MNTELSRVRSLVRMPMFRAQKALEPDEIDQTKRISFFTIGRKITGAQIVVVFLALVLASVSFFVSVKSDLERMLSQRLENVARTATLMLRGEDHEEAVKAFMTGGPEAVVASEGFKKIRAALEKVQKNNELTSDVYTLIDAERFADLYQGEAKDALKGNMMFMTMATKKDPYVGNMMPMHEKVRHVLKTSRFDSTPLYTDAEGTWVSAFAPVLDSTGKVVAVLEFDYNAKNEVAAANRQLLLNIILPSLLGLLLAIGLGYYIGKSLATPIRTLADVAELVAGGNFDVSVEVTTRDETGALGTVFNKMVSDLKRQRVELRDYAQNLEKKVAERTEQLNQANRSIQGMVDSVSQAFFMFESTGNCLPIYSRACKDLLGAAPAGKHAGDALGLSGEALTDFHKWYPLLFEELMPFDEVAPLGPRLLPADSRGRFITVEYFPVRDSSQRVMQVVAIATDRTAERNANQRAESEREYAGMILKLVKNRKHFAALVNETKTGFIQLKEELASESPNFDAVFRHIHTFKSATASYSMGEVAKVAHEYESELVADRKRIAAGDAVDLKPWSGKLDRLTGLFNDFLEENKVIIGGAASGSGPMLEIPTSEVKRLGEELRSISEKNRAVFSVFERKYLSEPVVNLLIHYDEVVSLTASRQQKEVAPIEFEGGDFRVMPEPLAPLAGAMVHAFRNAVDHGLETPDERVENGKPPTGKISVAFEAQEREGKRWIRVRVSDDGRGIDPEVIRAKLLGRGQQSVAQESDEQVIQHVFDAGFSTKDQVTDISGRGVGMDAIHYAVTTLGGACKVMSHPGKGTTLELDFPDPTPMS